MTPPLRLSDIPEKLTPEEFWALFGRIEHERLDFKRGVPSDVLSAIPAMAMTEGGVIVHGVDAHLNLTGCPLSQKTVDRITRFAGECGVEVEVRGLRVAETELTVTAVPEVRDRIVTTPDGRLLRRVGGDSQPLRGDAMARFVRSRVEPSGEEIPVSALRPSDIDLDALNRALEADGRPAVGRRQVEQALVDLQVAVPPDPRMLRAAAVLFARSPETFVPGARVQLVRREGTGPGPGPTAAREECSGPLDIILECCEDFVARHTERYEAVAGAHRQTLPQYPGTVVREAVLNALAHRDYGLAGATVDITLWDDRLEIRSPGPLPGHITPENIRREHYSRNRRIMRVLKFVGLVEEYGEGVDRMIDEMEARLMEPPIFAATSSSVTVTLRNRFLVSVEDQVWLSVLGRAGLSVAERRLLVFARREGAVTRRWLHQNMPGVDIRALLRDSVAKGLLVLVGERGGARYELSDEIILRAGSRGIEAQRRKRQMLLDEMDSHDGISVVEAAKLLGETVPAARELLNELIRSGAARSVGRTRGTRYLRA